MSWTKTREFMLVVVPGSRREYVCVRHEERGDRTWYNAELRRRGYVVDWDIDAAQAAEIQSVLREHGYGRVAAVRQLTSHEVVRSRSLPSPRPMILTVEL